MDSLKIDDLKHILASSAEDTYAKAFRAIPSHGLDHAFDTDVVADHVLVTSEQQELDTFQHSWDHGDRGVRMLCVEVRVNDAATLGPRYRRCCRVNGLNDITSLNKLSPFRRFVLPSGEEVWTYVQVGTDIHQIRGPVHSACRNDIIKADIVDVHTPHGVVDPVSSEEC